MKLYEPKLYEQKRFEGCSLNIESGEKNIYIFKQKLTVSKTRSRQDNFTPQNHNDSKLRCNFYHIYCSSLLVSVFIALFNKDDDVHSYRHHHDYKDDNIMKSLSLHYYSFCLPQYFTYGYRREWIEWHSTSLFDLSYQVYKLNS